MKPGRGKAKGSGFERFICHTLSLWVSGGKQEDLFWRSAISGGRSTQAFKKGKVLARQAGDICAVAPEGHSLTDLYYLECKNYRNLKIDRFIVMNTGTLAKFWRDTCTHARKYGRRPMLIAKQNGFPVLVIVRRGDAILGAISRIDGLNGAGNSSIVQLDSLMGVPYAG